MLRRRDLLDATGTTPAVDQSARNTLVAANIDFGRFIGYAAYGQSRGEGSSHWDMSNPYGAVAQTLPTDKSRDALFGVAVLNGIVMVSYINMLREKGRPWDLGKDVEQSSDQLLTLVVQRAHPDTLTIVTTIDSVSIKGNEEAAEGVAERPHVVGEGEGEVFFPDPQLAAFPPWAQWLCFGPATSPAWLAQN